MTETQTEQTEKKARTLTRLRALIFLILTLIIGVIVIVLATWWVVGSAPRSVAIAVDEAVTVEEFITLPDEDAYPAAVALADDGTLYTGSYATGALWMITPDNFISEVDDIRDSVGSITGLDVAPDGTLYILDRIVPLDAKGAIIWTYAEGELSKLVEVPNDPTIGIVLPDDITVDANGIIYVSDRSPARIWRFSPAGENLGVWWTPTPATGSDKEGEPTGLAYDQQNDLILITDSNRDRIHSVPASSADLDETNANTQNLYVDNNRNSFGVDGIDVAPTGEIYVALLNRNQIARIDGNALTMLAQDFRGASDVVYDPVRDALIVTNWNQFSLGSGTSPQLPFALDIIDLSPETTDE